MNNTTNILENILIRKREVIIRDKQERPIYSLMNDKLFKRKCYSAKKSITKHAGNSIIAEFKRQSPSKGIINSVSQAKDVISEYQKAGASMVSVLTDEDFFGAKYIDIVQAREILHIPILRKDFIIDTYQIYQSKAMGADVILLIASILSVQKCKDFAFLAHNLGMEVLLEINNEKQLKHINPYIDLIGVNNRNLKDFTVDINRSLKLLKLLPGNLIPIAESGLGSVEDLKLLRDYGFKAFLMGEYFMKNNKPGNTCEKFIAEISKA